MYEGVVLTFFMESNCLAFSGFNNKCDITDFQTYLQRFGYILYFLINQTHERGYLVFEKKESAIQCFQNMKNQNSNEFGESLTFSYCTIEEVNSAATLYNNKYKGVDLSNPSTNSKVFHITSTQPPVFWQLNH